MRKRKKYYNGKMMLFAVFTTIFIVSCYFLFSNKTFKYCSNENYLLGIHDSLPIIEVKYNQYDNDILEEIAIKLNKDTCCEITEFLLKLTTNEVVNVKLNHNCRKCNPFFGAHWNYDDLLISRNNELFYNSYLESIDSLSFKTYRRLKKQPTIDNMDFVIEWHKTSKKEIIEKVLLEIQKGYQLYYEEVAFQNFGKSICKLDKNEINQLKRDKSNIYLGTGNRFLPPLPFKKTSKNGNE